MLIGVVSDTHGYLDPRLLQAFRGVDVILHAGDAGSDAVLEGLRGLAPLYAVQGNNDAPLGGFGLPTHLNLRIEGASLHLVHELSQAQPSHDTTVIVFGHSHRQLHQRHGGVLHVNPGAAGRQGFHKLQTASLLRIEAGEVEVEEIVLGPRLAKGKPR